MHLARKTAPKRHLLCRFLAVVFWFFPPQALAGLLPKAVGCNRVLSKQPVS